MNFWQQHIVNEQGFEATKFTLAIADSYSELLSDSMTVDNRVDIIQLNDNFKDALNTDESSFKVKELSLSVDELSCQNDVNINCLSFLLECKKRSNTRYIALYETKGATAISFDNMLFLGKLDTKVTGDDIVWNTNSIYTHDIKAKRFYKFNALEFSVAVLDECSINKEIRDETGTKINNIYERTSRAEIEALQEFLTVKTGTVVGEITGSYTLNYRPSINLYDLLNYLLGKAELLINDLYGYNLSINVIESDIGFKGLPANIKDITRYNNGYAYYETSIDDSELSQAKEIYITNAENSTKSSIWLSASIFDPFIIYEAGLENKFTDFAQFEQEKKNLMTGYFAYSFRNIANISDLLFGIAKALGCYVIPNVSLVSGILTINIVFKSRKAFNDSTVIYPIGATDGSLDTSGESESSATEYYGEVNNFATDGIDTFSKASTSYKFEFSKNYENGRAKREQKNKLQKTDYKRLLLSTGLTLIKNTDNFIFIQNIYGAGSGLIFSPAEYMFSNLMAMKSNYGTNWARPIQSILWKDNGVNKNTSLVEYINSITANNREYYKTEYTLTVPYYSAFAIKDGSGAITSIGSGNLKIGRTIRIKERKKAFVSGSWVDFSEDVDFKIVEIEKNLNTPEVKLKLQSISAFAYGVYDGDGSEILGAFDNNDSSGGSTGLVGNTFQYYEIDSTSDDILNGDRVVITENQKLIKAKAHSDHYGLDFGFAKNSGVSGDFIPVDTGELSFCNDYTLTPLDVVFVRTGDDTTTNISQTGITDITGGENLYYKIGTALSPTVIKVEVEQYEFE